MGYPTWKELASTAIEELTLLGNNPNLTAAKSCFAKFDYPGVFEATKAGLGSQRLLELLRNKLKPIRQSKIYEIMARWPIPVYMTTNYDNELQNHLSHLGEPYLTYSNSRDHMNQLASDSSGFIVKLHGDLTSEDGLILTTGQYKSITHGSQWDYWRSKMAAIFTMHRVIVIGHSLSDKNIVHVLETAKKGSGFEHPAIWITPDPPSYQERTKFEADYRVSIIGYPGGENGHTNLLRILESISDCVPPRTIVRLQQQIPVVTSHESAAGFFVFNELVGQQDYENKRRDIIVSAIEAKLPALKGIEGFTIHRAIQEAGWPPDVTVESHFLSQVEQRSVERGILSRRPDGSLAVPEKALQQSQSKREVFEHARALFRQSLELRIRRDFTDLNDAQLKSLVSDIDTSLTTYFEKGGLTFASLLFSKNVTKFVPQSILHFILVASTKYDNLVMRLAFFKASLDSFVRAEAAQRDYLGRIAQGYFGFHALGVFGDLAVERIKIAKETLWLIDSDTQIHTLALGSLTNQSYRESLKKLNSMDVRLFTIDSLLDETREHLYFADKRIEENGASSPVIIAAARGDAPFEKSNAFLEGFIRWQAAGNPCSWQSYLYQALGMPGDIGKEVIAQALMKHGIEVVEPSAWPGFDDSHYSAIDSYSKKIVELRQGTQHILPGVSGQAQQNDPLEKAKPEAEAYNIVLRERSGEYHMLSQAASQSWFISNTSILNLIGGKPITWQPDAFLSFISTLGTITRADLVEEAFERIIYGLAESGLSLLDEETVSRVFGGIIDQAKLSIEELRDQYDSTIGNKYGEPLDAILSRMRPSQLPLAAAQLSSEIAHVEAEKRRQAETIAKEATARAEQSERELAKLQKFKAKMLKKQNSRKKKKKK